MAHDTTIPANLPPVTFAPRPPRLRRPPFPLVAVGLVSIVGSWLPLVLFARARVIPSNAPRVSFVQDMGTQPKFREQQSNSLFADGRGDRLPIPGTISRGHLEEDDHFYRGYSRGPGPEGKPQINWFDAFPAQAPVNAARLERGRQRFNIYCSACHGYDGRGHGTINERALEIMARGDASTTWTPAADLTSDAIRIKPAGSIYNTINVGIRSMAGYGAQISPADRWAIVSYVRALQTSQPPTAAVAAPGAAAPSPVPSSASPPSAAPPSAAPSIPAAAPATVPAASASTPDAPASPASAPAATAPSTLTTAPATSTSAPAAKEETNPK